MSIGRRSSVSMLFITLIFLITGQSTEAADWSSWAPFEDPKGVDLYQINVDQNEDGRLIVFALGSDGNVWYIEQQKNYLGFECKEHSKPHPFWRYVCYPMPRNAKLRDWCEKNRQGFITLNCVKGYKWTDWKSLGHPGTGVDAVSLMTTSHYKDVLVSRLSIFVTDKDRRLWNLRQTSNGWSNWYLLTNPSGSPIQEIEVEQNLDGRMEVFLMAGKSIWHMWEISQESNSWSSWCSLGNPTGGDPLGGLNVVRNKDGRLELFVASSSAGFHHMWYDNIYHIWQTNPNADCVGWSSWKVLATADSSITESNIKLFFLPLIVGQNKDGRLEVFFFNDTGLWHIYQTAPNNGWSKEEPFMPSPPFQLSFMPPGLSQPSAVGQNKDGRLGLILGDDENGLWDISQTSPNNGWSNWHSLGRPSDLDPLYGFADLNVACNDDGRLDVFIITDGQWNTNRDLWHIWQR